MKITITDQYHYNEVYDFIGFDVTVKMRDMESDNEIIGVWGEIVHAVKKEAERRGVEVEEVHIPSFE